MLTLIIMLSSILATTDGIAVLALVAMALNVSGSIGDLMIAYEVRQHDHRTLLRICRMGLSGMSLQSIARLMMFRQLTSGFGIVF
jgi:hypothetical protein